MPVRPRLFAPIVLALSVTWALGAQAAGTGLGPGMSGAGHLDVKLTTSNGPVAGSKITLGFNGDTSYYVTGVDALVTWQTGRNVYPGKMNVELDFGGSTLIGTDNPGFQAFAGQFSAAEQLFYRAHGALDLWTPDAGWEAPIGGETIALYGGLPPELATTCRRNPDGAACAPYMDGTRFTRDGVLNTPTAMVGVASAAGAFHSHLDFELLDTDGRFDPANGAYAMTLSLWSRALVGGAPKYVESDPFLVVLNHGLSNDRYRDAIRSLVVRPAVVDPIVVDPLPSVPEPATWAAFAAGLAALVSARMRRAGRR
ncbi:MAG: PEP-CTERM sorting domain-containing protein [Burkholderiales bacterium]|nr:PEP-CTERM sorting domain-containing protein [Burkholderiales bacterium]